MYHLSTFHFQKNEAVNYWAGDECIQKTTQKFHENNKISNLTSPKNGLKNAMKVKIFLMPSWINDNLNLVLSKQRRGGLRVPHEGDLLFSPY